MGIVIFKVGKRSGTATVHEEEWNSVMEPSHGIRKAAMESTDEESVTQRGRGGEIHHNTRRGGFDGKT